MLTPDYSRYDVSDPNDLDKIRKMTGICPQHDILFDELTCREHLKFFARIRVGVGDSYARIVCTIGATLILAIQGIPENEVDREVSQILQDVDLQDKSDTVASDLSGGQKRKLSVGVALIGDPKIIFLDEPTAGVDPYSRR